MKKRIWILFSIILLIGAIGLAGCTTADRRPNDTTPDETRTVPRQTRVTPPTTPTPGTTRTGPDNTRVVPRTTSPRTSIPDSPGTTNVPGTGTTPDTTSPRTVRRLGTTDDTARSQAKRIADAVAKEKNIDAASCVITGDTALIGVQFDKQFKGDLTDSIKKSVEKRVRSIEPDIDNVVVTADPDLLSRIKTIASDIENGKPLSGFTNEIEEIIRRINPF
ncbi:MAG: YhcN/YlaJ family sporulation lipoprotein [Caldicoprobacterales bacterium]|nr:YhcN/YlaJ family sporulation lipoprotein [Clostridiales bacterium]